MSHTERQDVTYYSGHVIEVSGTRYAPERTCHVVSSKTYYGSFGCEEAGTLWTLSCGHEVINDSDYPPSYCIECGAKVVAS